MKLLSLKNFKTALNKYIFPNGIRKKPAKPDFLQELPPNGACLERNPVSDEFQKQGYRQLISGLKNNDKIRSVANRILFSNPINTKTYSKMSQKELMAVRAQLSPDLIEDAETIVSVSKITKRLFDEKFGENQYRFISVGRSLSAVANCLEFMGVKTIQIPLSGCYGKYRDTKETVKTIIKNDKFENYKKFLKKSLFPPFSTKRVFCDYSCSGKTLSVFEALLKQKNVKLATKRDIYVGLNDFLSDFAANNQEQNIIKKFNNDLYRQSYDEYAEIGYLNFKKIEALASALKPGDLTENKLMKFCLLDILKTSKTI